MPRQFKACFGADPYETRIRYGVYTGLGYDEIHRNIVRLRMDRGQSRELEADADRKRSRHAHGERAVKVTAAVTQPDASRSMTFWR